MKPKLIILSHGQLSVEALKSAEMIVGKINGVWPVAMSMEDGKEGVKQKLTDILDGIDAAEPVIFLADILSGTPCNAAVEIMYEREHTVLIAGLTLAMIVEYAASSDKELIDMAHSMVNSSNEITRLIHRDPILLEESYEEE